MAFLNDEIYGDTAQIQHEAIDAFGSGRLVGKNLILTARHVVMHPDTQVAVEEGWKVRCLSGRSLDQQPGVWDWRMAKVVWRGKDALDLALLELLPSDRQPDATPQFQARIAHITHLEHHPVVAFGFPRGTRVDGKRSLFVPYGNLDDEKRSTLAFAIDQAYQPESPNEDWRGFSGSSVVLFNDGDPGAIWIYGVAESVPLHFSHRLETARLALAWNDHEFRSLWAIAQPHRSEPADPLHPNWTDFVECCQKVNKSQVDLLAETRRYENAVAISRPLLEEKIESFLQTEKHILALVGQTGTGKTFLMAHLAAAGMADSSLLLLAQKLDLNEPGIQDSIFAALTQTSPRIALLKQQIPRRQPVDRESGYLIVLLDGLNEAPVAAQTILRWLQASLPWMKANRVRLIVTSLPETWALVSVGIPSDDLYFESSAPNHDLREGRFVSVTDFNEEEALNAAAMYALDSALLDNPAFRHPLTLRMLRDGSTWKQSHSIFDLFRDYFAAVFARVRSTSQSVYPDSYCWSVMSTIARSMRSRSSLWIDPAQYFEIFGSAINLANTFIASHLLVEGKDGLRFTFDELVFSLIAGLPRSELEQQLHSESMLELAANDELFGESLPLILSRLDKENNHEEVEGILSVIAQSEHSELSFTSFRAHRIFLRAIRYLRNPAPFYEQIRQFVSRCAAVSSAYLERT